MQWSDLLSRPRPKATERINYGTDPNQFGDLWRPDGPDLHPLVIMIHGGCWTASIADLSIMDWAAEDLRQRGYLVWNVEYRRLGQPGGGYPGTYDDIRAAVNFAYNRPEFRTDPEWRTTVLLGHSAGGHLALWAAGQTDEDWPNLTGVVALGAITDLEHDTDTACGAEAPALMLGPKSVERPQPAETTSPCQMAPLPVPAILITGVDDTTVPLAAAQRYKIYAEDVGALPRPVQVIAPPGGHVEEITPGTAAWAEVIEALARLRRDAHP